jgi:hypothetical protein
MDLFTVAVARTYADWLAKNDPKPFAHELVDWLSAELKKKSGQRLRKAVFDKNDASLYKLVKPILEGKMAWLEDGIIK